MILILLEYPDTISVEVSASAIVPFVVDGRAALSTGIQVFGISMEKPSPLKGEVLMEESDLPQETRSKRQEKITNLFIIRKVKK